MATIRARQANDGTTRYQAIVRLSGAPARFKTFRRLTDAKRWAAQLEADLRRGLAHPSREAEVRTLAELLDRYESEQLEDLAEEDQRNRRRHLEHWRRRLGRYRLAHLRPGMIAEERDKLAKRDNTGPATVNRYLASLSASLTWATRELEWTDSNPCRRVKRLREPAGRVRFLSDDERQRLLTACASSRSRRLLPMVQVALCTGMRRGELLGLRWRDVDLGRGLAVLHETKNRQRRGVPLAGLALDALEALQQRSNPGAAFVFGGPRQGQRAPTFPRKPWEVAVAVAGLDDFHFHDLRHTAASYLAMSGATLAEIAEILGHKTLQMVKRYAHLTEGHTRSVAQRMADKFLQDAPTEGAEN